MAPRANAAYLRHLSLTGDCNQMINNPNVIALPARKLDAAFGGQEQTFAKGQEMFAEGDPAAFFYRIVYGSAGSSKLLSDARRQVDSFYFAGDMFGFECAEDYSVTTTALEDTKVMAFPRSCFGDLMRDEPVLAEQLVTSMSATLKRARDHMLLLARKTPRERLAMFLLDIAARLKNGKRITLP